MTKRSLRGWIHEEGPKRLAEAKRNPLLLFAIISAVAVMLHYLLVLKYGKDARGVCDAISLSATIIAVVGVVGLSAFKPRRAERWWALAILLAGLGVGASSGNSGLFIALLLLAVSCFIAETLRGTWNDSYLKPKNTELGCWLVLLAGSAAFQGLASGSGVAQRIILPIALLAGGIFFGWRRKDPTVVS